MNIIKNKLETIVNYTLPQFIEFKDWIIFKYQGSDLKFLFETIFLSIAANEEAKKIGEFKIGISCKKEYENWIPDSIKYFDYNEIKIEIPGMYKIIQFDHIRANHSELAKSLGIQFPLNLKNPFVDSSLENKKSIIIACNGIKEVSLPEEHEKYIYEYFTNHGYKINVLYVPDYYYKNHWSNSIAIKPSCFEEAVNLIQSSGIIIATDNCYLSLANTFSDKKVIGIFGPTKPRNLLFYNSMKVLQIIDENPIVDYSIKKSCTCEGAKFCHRGYKVGDYTYCLSSVSSNVLIQKIKSLL